jgi:hypothetical protein
MQGIHARPVLLVGMALAFGCDAISGGTLTGRATLDGEADHTGILLSLAGPVSATTETAADGSYHFAGLPEGEYVVIATASGTREGALTASAHRADGHFADLVFHPVGALAGRVTRGGAAAGNAGIVVLASGSSGVATTDDTGAFTLGGLAPGHYDLSAFTSGFLPGAARGVEVRRGETGMVAQIDLVGALSGAPSAGELKGKARVTGGGDASGIAVSLVGTSLATTTDADGSFVLPHPPDGIYSLSFDRGDFHEIAPAVLAIPGSTGFYLDGSLYPLDGATAALPRGRRQLSGAIDGAQRAPNGDVILFRLLDLQSGVPPTGALMSLPVAGGTPATLASRVGQKIAFSPDGKRVLFATGPDRNQGWDLASAPVGGGPAITLRSSILQTYQYTPDGRYVLTGGAPYTNELWAVPADGGPSVKLAANIQTAGFQAIPATSDVLVMANCASYPYYYGPCALLRAPLSGAAPAVVAGSVLWLAISPARDRIVYYTGDKLVAVDLSSGVTTQLFSGTVSYSYAFTPDGTRFVFVANLNSSHVGDVYSVPSTGGTATLLASGVNEGGMRLSPGGQRVYLEAYGQPALRAVPTAGGTIETLGQNGQYAQSFRFSPKGSWVAMLSDYAPASQSGTLSVGPAEGGPMHVVASAALSRAVVFSLDDAQIAYLVDDGHIGETGWLEVAPSAGGGAIRFQGGVKSIWSFSPGGTSLLYGTDELVPTSWVVPTSGGQPRGLLEASGTAFFASDDLVVGVRSQTAAPFSFQNGLYLLGAR